MPSAIIHAKVLLKDAAGSRLHEEYEGEVPGKKITSLTVVLKHGNRRTSVKVPRNQPRDARVTTYQKMFLPTTKLVRLSSPPAMPPRNGTRVREVTPQVTARVEGDASDPKITQDQAIPSLKFFRKGKAKGQPFRSDATRKQFLQRELSSME